VNVATKTGYAMCLFLFWILAAVYALSYSGVAVTDDEQLFASAALSLAIDGDLRAPQLYGNQRLEGIYRGVGPLHPAIAALVLRVNPFSKIGSVQLLFLLPPLYTALTGVLIFRLARQFGYPLHSGVFAALCFGLSTKAWPYSKTFFRETLAMPLTLATWLCFENMLRKAASGFSRLTRFAGFVLAFAGMALTKIQLAVALPIFAWIGLRKMKPELKKMNHPKQLLTGGFAVCLFASLIVIFMLDRILPTEINSRLSSSFLEFAWRRLLSTPHTGFWKAAAGALISPGKGFFWYSPVTILAVFSLLRAGKRQKREVYLPWLIFLALLVTQVLAYDENWWSITWSTRFLLPALPLMILAGLPILDHLLNSERRFYRLLPLGLFTFGVLIQLGTVLISDVTYLTHLYRNIGVVYPDPILWGWDYIPMIGHYGMILDGTGWDLLSWRTFELHRPATLALVFFSVGIVLTGLIGLSLSLREKFPILSARTTVMAASLTYIILVSLILVIARNDPSYYAGREDFKKANDWITNNVRSGDAIVVESYLEPLWHHLWNFAQAKLLIYSLPDEDHAARWLSVNSPKDSAGDRFYQSLRNRHERIWLACEHSCSFREVAQMRERRSLRFVKEWNFQDPQSGLQTDVILFEMP
jgi:hypothetical protein